MSRSVSTGAIKAMKDIASDPSKRVAIIKDSACLGGLVMVLSNSDIEIVQLALQTLLLLSKTHDHRVTLRSFLGLENQLETLIKSSRTPSTNLRLAETLYTRLMATNLDTENVTPLKDTRNSYNNNSMNASKSFSSKPHKARNTVLQIRGMIDKHDKDVVTRLLVQVKGVISITIDLKTKRCYVRSRLETKPEQLASAVAKSMTMTAQHVTKDGNGQEMLVSYGSHDLDADKENCELPSYLPDDVDNSPIADDKAISRTGRAKKSGGWLNTAANFLTSSFYW